MMINHPSDNINLLSVALVYFHILTMVTHWHIYYTYPGSHQPTDMYWTQAGSQLYTMMEGNGYYHLLQDGLQEKGRFD